MRVNSWSSSGVRLKVGRSAPMIWAWGSTAVKLWLRSPPAAVKKGSRPTLWVRSNWAAMPDTARLLGVSV